MLDPYHLYMTFLGTGTSTGVPVVACDCDVCTSDDPRNKRLRTSIMIQYKGHTFVVDCGPDFRYQMIRERVEDLDAILFTHEHRDHIGGLDDVRGFNYVLNKTIDVYAHEKVIEAIHKEFPYISPNKRFFGCPQLNFNPIGNEPFKIFDLLFTPIKVMHDKLEVYGFRFGDITYITDASYIAPEEAEKIKGSRVIVLNALRNSHHVSHFSLNEAINLIQEFRPQHAYLTHMSHFIGLHDVVEKKLPYYIHLAYDGLKVELDVANSNYDF
ncbi:MAG: MBL fold metallo-hydrolase [Bacteroidota bacterium]